MSRQLATYLAARADGAPVEIAAQMSGIGITEARLTEKAIESGEIELPRAPAPARTHEVQSPREEETMAREDVKTTIRMGGGPEVPIDLDKPINHSDNAQAAEQIAKTIDKAFGPNVAADELRLLIERIERLAEERKGIADDIADVYNEAKSRGYDKATIRRIVRLRAMDPNARQEAAALLETYASAVGLQDALPL